MSTGLECEFFHLADGRHFYLLQNWDCPVGAWDWREYATCYGPFTSLEEAQQNLRDNHANPGGYSIDQEPTTPDELLQGLIDKAQKPSRWRF